MKKLKKLKKYFPIYLKGWVVYIVAMMSATGLCSILQLLGKSAGKVLTYDFIMKELWGSQSRGSNQILRVNMANIRRKIEKNPAEPEYIFTEIGVGYRMIEGDKPE